MNLSARLVVIFGLVLTVTRSQTFAAASDSSSGNALASVHWVGKQWLNAETRAAGLMRIWQRPESARVEAQIIEKLSTAPWRALRQSVPSNAAPLLSPVLQDLLQQECFLEIRSATNQTSEMVLAVRLSSRQADVWETNLSAAVQSLTGMRPVAQGGGRRGWVLRKHHAPDLIELVRLQDWVLLGAAQGQNRLLAEMSLRIEQNTIATAAHGTNSWLEMDVDVPASARALSVPWSGPENFPRVSLAVAGSGEHVVSRSVWRFPRPHGLRLEPWNIPTNLITQPLASFSAARGIREWLGSWGAWKNLGLETPPDRFYAWSQPGPTMFTYVAVPAVNASNQVVRLSDLVVNKLNPALATGATSGMPARSWAEFRRSQRFNGVEWAGVPVMAPFIKSTEEQQADFILAGLMPQTRAIRPPPEEMLRAVFSRTNTVYYNGENTATRVEAWLGGSQFARLIFRKPQLLPDSAAVVWLKQCGALLGHAVTELTLNTPNELLLTRQSTVGFTALELHLLFDWFESPDFPFGFYSTRSPIATPRTLPSVPRVPATNASPGKSRS